MNALVTGGAGFIGSHLVDLLESQGHEVTVVARPGESLDNIAAARSRVVRCDILDRTRLLSGAPQADILYHLAARVDLDGRTPHDYAVNLAGTENVCELARRNGTRRLVFYSSMLSVALTGRREPVDESAEAENPSIYGRTKRAGERIVAGCGVPWTIIRPTLVYGPRERSTMREFFRAVRRRRFMLIGGDVVQSFVYVKNLVHGTYHASLHPAAEAKVYFLNDARPYTLGEFAAATARACGTSLRTVRLPRAAAIGVAYLFLGAKKLFKARVPLTPSRVRTLTTHYVYSIARAQQDFDYRPPYDLEPALEETVEWYRQQGVL